MTTSRMVIFLGAAILILAIIVAAVGLFWQTSDGKFSYPTTRQEIVELYGDGLYSHDSLLIGAGFRGQDVVTLFLASPLLLFSLMQYRRRSLRGAMMLSGVLAYFIYVYASMALGAAYNNLFFLYVVIFSASLFGLVFLLASLDLKETAAYFSTGVPLRGLGIYLLATGLLTLVVWVSPVLDALIRAAAPAGLGAYTTTVTYALDLAIIVPLTFLASAMIRRGDLRGCLVAFPLLSLITLLLPVMIASTVSQVIAGVDFTPAEIIGPISGFVVMGSIGAWFAGKMVMRLPHARAN